MSYWWNVSYDRSYHEPIFRNHFKENVKDLPEDELSEELAKLEKFDRFGEVYSELVANSVAYVLAKRYDEHKKFLKKISFINDDVKDYFNECLKKYLFINMIELYNYYEPDFKDIMRGETCKSDKAAVAQLKRIEDRDKFWRRLKSLLQHKFVITSLKGTAYENINTDLAEKWLTKASAIYQNKNDESMDVLDNKVNKLAKIIGI